MTRTRRLFGWRFWVGRGIVALVLGVVTTVGVAWGLCARGLGAPINTYGYLSHHGRLWVFEFHGSWGGKRVIVWDVTGDPRMGSAAAYAGAAGSVRTGPPGPEIAEFKRLFALYEPHYEPWTSEDEIIGEIAVCGWPLPALYSVFVPTESSAIVEKGVVATHSDPDLLHLPGLILWRGFLANVFLFGAVWSVPLMRRPLRAWSRVRRGCCPRCGYDLRGIDAPLCPECGHGAAPPPIA